MITGASYNSRVTDNQAFKAVNLTFDSVETRNVFFKAYLKRGKKSGGVEVREAVKRLKPQSKRHESKSNTSNTQPTKTLVEVSGVTEETDSGAEADDKIILDNDVEFSDPEDETKVADLREHLNTVLPELTENNARELAAEIASGGNITIPQKQMEENILHKLKEIRRQNEINEANITKNSPSCTQDTSGVNEIKN